MKSSLPFLTLCFLCSLLFNPGHSRAQEPQVRASMSTTDTLYVGQRTTLAVELLVPGFFAGTPIFDLPDPQGLILIPPAGSPVVSSETIGDTSYTVQRHEVAVLAEHPGEITIPAFSVRFAYRRMPLDKDAIPAEGRTTPVKFTAVLPPGAEKLGHVISARNLTVEETWKPEPGKTPAKAGDAFTRTITFTAPDVPGMMFPPFPTGAIEGIGIYPKEPEVLDMSNRGTFTGTRREVFTYACQRAGKFTIPAARLTWWDLEAKQLRTVDFPERAFEVAPNPALETAPAATASVPGRTKWARGPVAVVVALLLCAIVWRRRLGLAMGRLLAPLRPLHLQPLNPKPDTVRPQQ